MSIPTAAAAMIIRNLNGEILLQDHIKHNFLTCPIGGVEVDESHSVAIMREMREELGITIMDYTTIYIGDINCGGQLVDTHIFELNSYLGTIRNNEPHKCRGLHWFSPAELKSMMGSGTRISTTLQVYLNM